MFKVVKRCHLRHCLHLHMTTAIGLLYFAGTKNNLLSQTTKRLRTDLINGSVNAKHYKLFENPTKDDSQRIRNALHEH